MSDDLILQQMVIDELMYDPRVDAAHIGVSIRDGVVSLSGHVASFAEKQAAEQAVRRVKGVRAVAQELAVALPADKRTADDEIAARAVRILDWDVLIPPRSIDVKVEHGIVTLSGTVNWGFERTEAEDDVRKLGGVVSVLNDIRVRPRVADEDVRGAIRAALERHAELEASRITVAVEDGKVVLSGTTESWGERQELERAAWSAPGVTEVENHVVIARP